MTPATPSHLLHGPASHIDPQPQVSVTQGYRSPLFHGPTNTEQKVSFRQMDDFVAEPSGKSPLQFAIYDHICHILWKCAIYGHICHNLSALYMGGEIAEGRGPTVGNWWSGAIDIPRWHPSIPYHTIQLPGVLHHGLADPIKRANSGVAHQTRVAGSSGHLSLVFGLFQKSFNRLGTCERGCG